MKPTSAQLKALRQMRASYADLGPLYRDPKVLRLVDKIVEGLEAEPTAKSKPKAQTPREKAHQVVAQSPEAQAGYLLMLIKSHVDSMVVAQRPKRHELGSTQRQANDHAERSYQLILKFVRDHITGAK